MIKYVIAMPTLTLLKSQSQQNAADTLPLQHILPMTPQKEPLFQV